MFCQARVTCLLQILSVNITQFSKGTAPSEAAGVISEEDKGLLKQLLLDIIDGQETGLASAAGPGLGVAPVSAPGPGLGLGHGNIASAALQVFTVSFKLLYATSAERLQLLSRFVTLHTEDRLSPQASAILERVLHQLAEPSTLMDMQGTQGHSAVADERRSEPTSLMSLLLTVYRKELTRKLGVANVADVTAVDVSSTSSSSSSTTSSSSSLYDATVMVMVSMVKIRCPHIFQPPFSCHSPHTH